jgi:taurine dioxygenase
LHTGTLYDDTKYDRLMHRLWAKGDKPIGVPKIEAATAA